MALTWKSSDFGVTYSVRLFVRVGTAARWTAPFRYVKTVSSGQSSLETQKLKPSHPCDSAGNGRLTAQTWTIVRPYREAMANGGLHKDDRMDTSFISILESAHWRAHLFKSGALILPCLSLFSFFFWGSTLHAQISSHNLTFGATKMTWFHIPLKRLGTPTLLSQMTLATFLTTIWISGGAMQSRPFHPLLIKSSQIRNWPMSNPGCLSKVLHWAMILRPILPPPTWKLIQPFATRSTAPMYLDSAVRPNGRTIFAGLGNQNAKNIGSLSAAMAPRWPTRVASQPAVSCVWGSLSSVASISRP